MIKIVFITRSLEYGGAERQLVSLAKGLDKSCFNASVLCFYSGGELEKDLKESQIMVIPLNKRKRWDILPFFFHLVKTLKRLDAHIIHGYLEVPNILTILVKPWQKNSIKIAGVRASFMDMQHYDWLYKQVRKVEAFLSRFSDLIIVNSEAGRKGCIERGFPGEKLEVVPNGIDTVYYQFDSNKGSHFREKWGITQAQILIGLIGRIDAMKDHPTFIEAASILTRTNPDIRLICVGDGKKAYWDEMKSLAAQNHLDEYLIWAGAQMDMPSVYSSLDILCSSSRGEGFSNVIGEAMSCEIPCVVTDVGDSALIIGETGSVVPPGNPLELAHALDKMAGLTVEQRRALGKKCRQRIVNSFSLQTMIDRSSDLFEEQVKQRFSS